VLNFVLIHLEPVSMVDVMTDEQQITDPHAGSVRNTYGGTNRLDAAGRNISGRSCSSIRRSYRQNSPVRDVIRHSAGHVIAGGDSVALRESA